MAAVAATAAQLAGLDAVKIISLIVTAADNARMHKKNCRKFGRHMQLIGGLLEQLKLSELKKRAETREPLEQLEDALKRAYVLIDSCQEKSYLYVLAMGWTIVKQFEELQAEIDKYLKLIPLIALVESNRGRLKAVEKIERDKCEYTLDEEEVRIRDTILKPQQTRHDSISISRELTRNYPGMTSNEALRKENSRLRRELEQQKRRNDTKQVEVINHLLGVTKAAVDATVAQDGDHEVVETKRQYQEQQQPKASKAASYGSQEWRHGLFDCWTAPCTCLSTFICPCCTFQNIADFVTQGDVSKDAACNDFMYYSLFLGCFCYTCGFRTKVRSRYHISGNRCDDLCIHTMCFCCALIQEWRELESREIRDLKGRTKTLQAPVQETMER